MSSLPRKSVTGLPLKKYVLDTLNGLIDYLHTHRIQAGRGIDVRETAAGYVIGLAKPPSNPPQVQNAGGGGGADGIEANVTGGTASITLSGGTGSVNLVGTGSVTISGNTNTGDIEINATGGTGIGAPDYAHPIVDRGSVVMRTPYGAYSNVAHLIGSVVSIIETVGGDDYIRGDLYADFVMGGSTSRVYLASFDMPTTDSLSSLSVPISLIIPSGATVTLGSQTDPVVSELAIYPSI